MTLCRTLVHTLAIVLTFGVCCSQMGHAQELSLAQDRNETAPTHKDDANANQVIVNALIDAFNEHDPKKMVKLVDPGIELYYVGDNGKTEMSLSSATDLEKEMSGYFRAVPDVKSTIKDLTVAGRFVSAQERVEWTRQGKKVSQFSLSVYEIQNEKIRRVWYYPAQR